jgi:hypothetical protein
MMMHVLEAPKFSLVVNTSTRCCDDGTKSRAATKETSIHWAIYRSPHPADPSGTMQREYELMHDGSDSSLQAKLSLQAAVMASQCLIHLRTVAAPLY